MNFGRKVIQLQVSLPELAFVSPYVVENHGRCRDRGRVWRCAEQGVVYSHGLRKQRLPFFRLPCVHWPNCKHYSKLKLTSKRLSRVNPLITHWMYRFVKQTYCDFRWTAVPKENLGYPHYVVDFVLCVAYMNVTAASHLS